MSDSSVENFYDGFVEHEWRRLARHRTEFAITRRVLAEFLPPPPARILDAGGGPGRYALALAAQGYEVTLLDLSAANLAFAQEKAAGQGVELAAAIQANVLALDTLQLPAFDAVLMMGPLYHLPDAGERQEAVRQATACLRPGGPLFAAFITRTSAFRKAAVEGMTWPQDEPEYAMQLLETGVHPPDRKFPVAYFAAAHEIRPLMEGQGLRTLRLMGCEGVVSRAEEMVNGLEGDAWELWLELNYRIGLDPAALAASDHILYVGEKRG